MKLKELGGEEEILKRLLSLLPTMEASVVLGPGDDCAVIELGAKALISVDAFCEGRDFSLEYYSPLQVGAKAIETAASDIVAMAGEFKYALLSLVVNPETELAILEEVYRGVARSLKRLNATLIGGDLTKGKLLELHVTVIGVGARKILTRAGAKSGDHIFVSGDLGSSAGGLYCLQNRIPGFETLKQAHLETTCRSDLVQNIAEVATSMIDVSDGLLCDLNRLATASGVGASIDLATLPVLPELEKMCRERKISHHDFSLRGGEDYQLLYTVPSSFADRAPGVEIGKIVPDKGLWNRTGGDIEPLQASGFDHFK